MDKRCLPEYKAIPSAASGTELASKQGSWSVIAPQPTTNLIINPSMEYPLEAAWTLIAGVRNTVQPFRGAYSIELTPAGPQTSLAAVQGNPSVSGFAGGFTIPATGQYIWSFWIKGVAGEQYEAEFRSNGQPVIFTANGNWERKTVTAYSSPTDTPLLRVYNLSNSTKKWYTDAWQLEAATTCTTYVDGDHLGGQWTGTPNQSTTIRALYQPGGYLYQFKGDPTAAGYNPNLDLQFPIEGQFGFGLFPVLNQALPQGLLSGASYQRTLGDVRMGMLVATIEGTVAERERIKERMEEIFTPWLLEQQGKPLILLYQSTDPTTGQALGKTLQIPCYYVDGLKGGVESVNQERISLQFACYMLPGITEYGPEYYSNICYQSVVNYAGGLNVGTTFARSAYGWARDTLAGSAFALYQGNRVFGTTATRVKELSISGNPPTLTNTVLNLSSAADPGTPSGVAVLGMAVSGGNRLYCGGTTNSGNFVRCAYYVLDSGNANWSAMAQGINSGQVNAVAASGRDSNVYLGGTFITAGNSVAGDLTCNRIVNFNGSQFSAMISGGQNGCNNTVNAIAVGLDGTVYVGGAATQFGNITTNRIAAWAGYTTAAWTALPAGGTGADNTVRAIAVNPTNGQVVIGGDFATVNGVSCSKVALYNGVNWTPLGPGLDNSVYGLWFDANGILYAYGAFSGTGGSTPYNLPFQAAMWNGSVWLPIDMDMSITPTVVAGITNGQGQHFLGTTALAAGSVGAPYMYFSCQTTINNSSTADVSPRLQLKGPGSLWSITNETTGKALYFRNFTLNSSEIITLNLVPNAISITSNQRYGNLINFVLPGSDLSSFGLIPGTNYLQALITGTTDSNTGIGLYYFNTHSSTDAGTY